MGNLVQIWSPDDFDQAVADAMALLAPERDPAPVVDITTKRVVR